MLNILLPITIPMSNGFITSLNKANVNSESLRTTVPTGIVKQFDLKDGDKLSWKMDVVKNKLIIHVEPVK